jgi:histidine triad (HIT) family protein
MYNLSMNDTVFGKIIRGEIPATKVYEDEEFLAFLDITPVTKGHTLLIPKEQYTWIHDAPDEVIAKIFVTAKKIIEAQRASLSCDYIQVGVIEVIQTSRPYISYESPEEMSSYAEKISRAL